MPRHSRGASPSHPKDCPRRPRQANPKRRPLLRCEPASEPFDRGGFFEDSEVGNARESKELDLRCVFREEGFRRCGIDGLVVIPDEHDSVLRQGCDVLRVPKPRRVGAVQAVGVGGSDK